MEGAIRTKPIGEDHVLVLARYESHHDFPGQEVLSLTLESNIKAGSGLPISSSMLVTSPSAYVISRAAYEAIFDAIHSEEEFMKLREPIGSRADDSCGEIYPLVKRVAPQRQGAIL